ncbi:MAG: AEC family transporter [Planctomycetota bacterium]
MSWFGPSPLADTNGFAIGDFLPIAASVLSVFLVMGVGATCRTKQWLTKSADISLAKLTANVLLPSLFLDRILTDDSLSSLVDVWQPPLFGFVETTCSFLFALLLARKVGPWFGLDTDGKHRAFALCAGICNYGYIPLPLAQIFYPSAEVELIFHNVGVDLALWSVGVSIIAGTQPDEPISPDRQPPPSPRWKRWRGRLSKLVSPPLIAVVLALSIRSTGLDRFIPGAVMKTLGWLAGTSIPMGLLLSGAIIIDFIRDADWHGSFKTILAAIGYRQFLMPILMLAIAKSLADSVDLQHVLLLQAAMPAAIFPIVLTRLYGGDTATALRVVLSTSLAALVFIPGWMAVGAWFLGV